MDCVSILSSSTFLILILQIAGQQSGSYKRKSFPSTNFKRKLSDQTFSNDSFQLTLHWEEGFKWIKERNFCAQCINLECENGSIILNECDKNEPRQRWTYGMISNKMNSAVSTTQCLSYRSLDRVTTKPCKNNQSRNSWQNVEMEKFSGDMFQIRAGGLCLSVRGRRGNVPDKDNLLQFVNCNTALSENLAYWKRGTFEDGVTFPHSSPDPTSVHTNTPTSVPTAYLHTPTPTDSPTVPFKTPTPTGIPTTAPHTHTPTGNPTVAPHTHNPTSSPTTAPHTNTPTGDPTAAAFDSNNGFFNERDICKKEQDNVCPCYPQDDDWYCSGSGWNSWDLSATINNVESDSEYELCDAKKFQSCGPNQKLCPMRKPRLDRWHDDRKDVYFAIDYDCIQCVPKNENCSKCSPGIWCHAIGRCVAPGRPARWCRETWPNNPNQE